MEERTILYQRSELQPTYFQKKLKQLASSCEWRICFSQSRGQKWGSLPLLSLVPDALRVRKHCWLLQGKATQQIEQQAENSSDNCILGINYSFPGHAFVTRNSNLTTTHSLCWGAWTARHETKKHVQWYTVHSNFNVLVFLFNLGATHHTWSGCSWRSSQFHITSAPEVYPYYRLVLVVWIINWIYFMLH